MSCTCQLAMRADMSLSGETRRLRKISRRQLLVLIGLCKYRKYLKAGEKYDQFIRLTDSDLVLETRLETLGRSCITANEDFFVLSRVPVNVSRQERSNWQLSIRGQVDHPIDVGIEELRNSRVFPREEVYACIQCAGYGRRFFEPAFEVAPWGVGAIGNARWGGVRLADVLKRARLRSEAKHIAFAGKDVTAVTPPYIKSIAIDKAMEPETLLAFEMNGVELPVSHGGPLRMLVPGWAGTYSVKWLQRIEARAEPWNGYWMSVAYQLPISRAGSVSQMSPEASIPITAVMVNSLITKPLPGDRIPAKRLVIEGFAWSGTAPVDNVEVSTTGGKSWRPATLSSPSHRFAWRRWYASWTPSPGVYRIVARAHDRSGATQPLDRTKWNPGGYEWQTAPSALVTVV
jgi:DMSO/TMAO reductase YedYZ molybdopterin-dependent catalytic subunit